MKKRSIIVVGLTLAAAAAAPALAQEVTPSTWRDPDTRCVYLKVGDTMSLRYRRDGTPDCASVPQATTGATITRNDFQDLTRSIEGLRRDIGGVRRELEDLRRTMEQSTKR
jgi:hypothetical protein